MKKLLALLACVGLFLGCTDTTKKTDTKKVDTKTEKKTNGGTTETKKTEETKSTESPAPPAKEEQKK